MKWAVNEEFDKIIPTLELAGFETGGSHFHDPEEAPCKSAWFYSTKILSCENCQDREEYRFDFEEDPPDVFFDWVIKPESGCQIFVNGQLAGVYCKKKHILIASDWTHSTSCVQFAINVLKKLFPEQLQDVRPHRTSISEVPSQKAKGLMVLRNKELASENIFIHPFEYNICAVKDIPVFFLRPCPQQPRHGIIESKVVENSELHAELKNMEELMKKYGEQPIIAVTPYIESSWSAVWDAENLIIGPDNDGVTAGKKPIIALRQPWPLYITNEDLKLAGIDGGVAEAELELVGRQFTQIRRSPEGKKISAIPKGAFQGFLPVPVLRIKDAEIFEVQGTDIEVLESYNPTSNKPILVFHKDGNILSHASAWCRMKGWGYVAAERKQVTGPYLVDYGEGYVVPAKKKPPKQVKKKKLTVKSFKKEYFDGVEYALNSRLYSRQSLTLAFFFHHFATETSLNSEVAYLAGFFTGALLKATLAICTGEARHAGSKAYDPEGVIKEKARNMLEVGGILFPEFDSNDGHRSEIYDLIFESKLPLEVAHDALDVLVDLFYNIEWSSGYGGPTWGKIAKRGKHLARYLMDKKLKQAINVANELLNLVHNNGWAFNKLAGKEILDLPYRLSEDPYYLETANLVFRLAMQVLKHKLPEGISVINLSGRKPSTVNVKTAQEAVQAFLDQKRGGGEDG